MILNRSGFTFAELLAAMLFMAIVIPVTIQGVVIANRAGVTADRKKTAAHLADRLLTELIVTDEWQDSDRQGDFGEDWPNYHWTLEDETWDEDGMKMVTVYAFYTVQENEYQVSLSSLVEEEE